MIRVPVLLSLVLALWSVAPAMAAYQSQTFIRFSNGMIQTLPAVTVDEYLIWAPGVRTPTRVKNAAMLYDKRNPLPTINIMGANYAFLTNGTMVTVNEAGSFYYKGKIPYQPESTGGNYFINKGTREIIVIDSEGFYVPTAMTAPAIRLNGGNFFIDQSGVLTTIKYRGASPGSPIGLVTAKDYPGHVDFSDVLKVGGNYMLKVDGTIVGVNSENGFFTEPQRVDAQPSKIGGNYFIGHDNVLYTVSSLGEVKKWQSINGAMKYFGYSYMIDADGDFIFVDGNGVPHTELVNVSTTGVESKVVKRISTSLESYQGFTRRTQ
jgi:hypothetical protein